MKNNSVDWVREMQKLQAKTEGEDIRSQLVECLHLCYLSHLYNTNSSKTSYLPIISWNGNLPLPDGWYIDPRGIYAPIIETNTSIEGENNG